MKTLIATVIAALALWIAPGASTASAQQLTVGAATIPSIDPHFAYFASNVAYAKHVFSMLTHVEKGTLNSDLALSWKSLNPTTWEFKLRPDVKFHDGTSFTADDVAFSIDRVLKIQNSPVPYAALLTSLKEVRVIDPLTVQIVTSEPEPLLPRSLSSIAIVSKRNVQGLATADFSSGKAAIGTGPFKFASYIPGERYEMVRNDDYYAAKPAWQKVVFRIITQDSSRIAALLAGDVDLIDAVPPGEVPKLRENKSLSVHQGPSDRIFVMYFKLNQNTNQYLVDKQGKPLDRNPFKDVRVREALSLALDRTALVNRVMNGAATPINQMTHPNAAGFNRQLPALAFDTAKAKRLLADAGYPNGFGLTVHCSNDRYPNDGRVCQTVGQMLARIGLDMKVEALPKAVFFAKMFPPAEEWVFGLMGIGDPSGEGSTILSSVLQTRDPAAKAGMLNAANYSNAQFDKLALALKPEFDPAKRASITRDGMALIAKDLPYLPIFAGSVVAASKKGINFTVRVDEMTLAKDANPAR